jgi:hypothetical protein
MENINKRLSVIEKTIKDIYSSMKKIEDCKKKSDLKDFTINQLLKWLKDNEVEFREDLKENLIDIVWKNMNEWEWEEYDDEEEEDQEEESEEDQEEESEEEAESDDDMISNVSESSKN